MAKHWDSYLSHCIPLNGYLHKIKRVATAACPACGHLNETPQHYIMECPTYKRESKADRKKGGFRGKVYEDHLRGEKAIHPSNLHQGDGQIQSRGREGRE